LNILALDPATHMGWAHSCGDSGVWDLSIKRDESAGMRLIRLRSKLDTILESMPIEVVVFEAARNAGPRMQGALVVQAEIQSVIKVWCEDNWLEYRGVSPMEIKKHATGKGQANKAKMVAAAKKKWPTVNIVDDNQADALWILDFLQSQLGVE
jgi:Holliday junction resolvasome RuvABC endonuclease subunit